MSIPTRIRRAPSRKRTFLADVVAGLAAPRKTLPCKYFYDEHGSQLFDQICDLPEYYPTRTELGILRDHSHEMMDWLGPRCGLIEYGSGSSMKTRLLLDAMGEGVYFPVDISRDYLRKTAERLQRDYDHIEVVPVFADFTRPFDLPPSQGEYHRRVVYFSGSTIGNFLPVDAIRLLRQISRLVGVGGGLLIGVDLKKDRSILEPAYDDAAGVTAAFNLNLLQRINRELGADFDLDCFRHRAHYNEVAGRIEMHLESLADQVVHVGEQAFDFIRGETICTEHSHKYSLDDFARLASHANLEIRQVWCDDASRFSVQYAERVAD